MTYTVEGVLALPPEPALGPSHFVSDSVDRLRELFAEAGFKQVDAKQVEGDILNNYYIARKA